MIFILIGILAVLIAVMCIKAVLAKPPVKSDAEWIEWEPDYERIGNSISEKASVYLMTRKYSNDAYTSFLEDNFPDLMKKGERLDFEKSIMFRIPAEQKGSGLPVLFVAVAQENNMKTREPGALRAAALLEAADEFIKNGYTATRDLYILIASELKARDEIVSALVRSGLRFDLAMSEGPGIIETGKKGQCVGAIGVANKPVWAFTISCEGDLPLIKGEDFDNPIEHITDAVSRLGRHPVPLKLDPIVKTYVKTCLYSKGFFGRLVSENLYITAPFVKFWLLRHYGEQLVRTVTSPVSVRYSDKKAEADFLVSPLPNQDVQKLRQYIEKTVKDDFITVSDITQIEKSGIVMVSSVAYDAVAETVIETFPDTVPAPAIVCGGNLPDEIYTAANSVILFSPCYPEGETYGQTEFFRNLMTKM